ncbi:hypothetical protein MHU86_24398 [Fragilaria crotonensis]|nr:hypothetical protein MHU86_24398 [Fragilaria crotonensis]
MPSPPLGNAANKSNVVHSLTDVIHQVQERRADTIQCMQDEHNSSMQWLNEKFDSYKRKLLKETDAAEAETMGLNPITNAPVAMTATIDAISNKKIKTAANSSSKFGGGGATTYGQKENQPPHKSSTNGNNIFKQPKHSSLTSQQKQFQLQKQTSQSSLNMSIKTSQIVVPVYPDEFSTHPQYLSVMSMKVPELRKELRTKNLRPEA